jgi:catechol 2,3-dioxygenase-like lactoylglutathione lyase family enzyme
MSSRPIAPRGPKAGTSGTSGATMVPMSSLTWLGVPGDEPAWKSLGFVVDGAGFTVGRVRCSIGNSGWGFDEIHSDASVLGVPTVTRPMAAPATHPCGVTAVDHIVYTVPNLDSAVDALNAVLGAEPRRRFHPRGAMGPEMAFYRVGEAFIEVVADGREPALIGLALKTSDLDATVEQIRSCGGPISDPKPAVQGGRIASVWIGHLNWGLAVLG